VELELTMLFADVRGSTSLAEGMTPTEFTQLISRFYSVSTAVLIDHEAIIDKLVGDQVTGLFTPGLAGPEHARRAVDAARDILRLTGHAEPDGPWISVGAGVHTGRAYVGAVGESHSTTDITVLGDAANTAARLSSSARLGEILISDASFAAAQLPFENLEQRQLELKGKREPVSVRVLTDFS
jgi:adenylate cyclase